MKFKSTLLFMATFVAFFSNAQNEKGKVDIPILKAEGTILVDGRLTEDIWIKAAKADGFYQIFPVDSIEAISATRFMLTYDADNLYIGLICYDQNPDIPHIAQSLRRDFNWARNDNVSVYIDPFNDRSNGFAFQVTPFNVKREGLVTLGGSIADDWDNKWYSETTITDSAWIAEMAIPFSSFRYNSSNSWGIQVLRNNLKINERSAWIRVPIQYSPSDLVYSGRLVWDEKLPKQGTNISFIPYVTSSLNRDFDAGEDYDPGFNTGFDAKVGITNSLNLDLTVNPDFSQVEVDQQVTNLNRFEIFFPERRQFFLENQDLFAQNGFPSARPFFSRRIGIGYNDDGLARQLRILGGARLSGKIGQNWRVGALSMQTAADAEAQQPAQNYSVGVFQRQIFGRSNVGAIIVNRQALNYNESDTTLNTSAYNRVYGVDYNLLSVDNRWEGNFFYHRSIDPETKAAPYSTGAFIRYEVREFSIRYNHTMIGDGYNAEVGFVPRTGIKNFGFGSQYSFYPSRGRVQRHGPSLDMGAVTDDKFNRLDNDMNLSWEVSFLNTAYFEAGSNFNSILLLDDFDPTNTDGAQLDAGERFDWFNYYVFYRSDNRKTFNYAVRAAYGGYFNGTRLPVFLELNYRYQPFLSVGIRGDFNKIDLPEPYNSTNFYLIGPRIDVTLNTSLFFTTFVQYNNQIDNLNINSRLQWRFKPVSDLFIVYTDNYNTLNFQEKNRAIVVKLSYWFNL